MLQLANTTLLILLLSLSATVAAAPVGYSVNSDSGSAEPTPDSLFEIDLGEGKDTRVAQLDPRFLDVEGLAFAPDRKLYALDDNELRIFQVNEATGMVELDTAMILKNLPSGGKNDFGMAFGCDGTLYITSVGAKALYRLDLNGQATAIGPLATNISALAAWGNPTQLYGLGNGLRNVGNDQYATDAPNLYSIDTVTGAAKLIGALGEEAAPYTEGGLDFDEFGQLWAITDRSSPAGQPSQVMKIDKATGKASQVKNLSEYGFESLAIAPPGGCTPIGEEPPPLGNEYTQSVPTMNRFAIALASILVLLTGLFAARRF